jgi:hypothetical protein
MNETHPREWFDEVKLYATSKAANTESTQDALSPLP